MVLVNNGLLMVINIKDNLEKEKFKVKELFYILMEINIQDNFIIANLMDVVFLIL